MTSMTGLTGFLKLFQDLYFFLRKKIFYFTNQYFLGVKPVIGGRPVIRY
jgi:hypothetical protein